jgi:hypothetical protein
MMKHPIYLFFAFLSYGYLALSHSYGWSPFQSFSQHRSLSSSSYRYRSSHSTGSSWSFGSGGFHK